MASCPTYQHATPVKAKGLCGLQNPQEPVPTARELEFHPLVQETIALHAVAEVLSLYQRAQKHALTVEELVGSRAGFTVLNVRGKGSL